MKPTHTLIRAHCDNNHFERLLKQWGRPKDGGYSPLLDHAGKVSSEKPMDKKYGIYVLVKNPNKPVYDGLVHVNHMHPNTSKPTLRMVWNLLDPRFLQSGIAPREIAELTAAYLFNGIRLCKTDMPSKVLKMYLQNGTDRRYASGIVAALRLSAPTWGAAIRGMWLQIDRVPDL